MISRLVVHLAFCSAVCFVLPVGTAAQQTPDSTDLRASASRLVPVDATPRIPITPELRGDIYMARKMYREAIDMYREGPEDSPVLANKIGIAFHQLLQLDLAKKNYERAIKLKPAFPEGLNNLGTIYYAEKSYKRAITYYKRALKYPPQAASIYANLGAAYFARKDYKRATQNYEEALKLDPDVFEHRGTYGTIMQERTIGEIATFHLYLAKMYAKAGRDERAIIYLRKALEEGVKDRKKIPDMPEFAGLKTNRAFKELLAEDPKPL